MSYETGWIGCIVIYLSARMTDMLSTRNNAKEKPFDPWPHGENLSSPFRVTYIPVLSGSLCSHRVCHPDKLTELPETFGLKR